MIAKSTILSTAERLDAWLPRMARRRESSRQRLVILVVHALYQRPSDADTAGVFPHERMTVDKLRHFIECFFEMGYTFLSPVDVSSSSHLPDKAMMLTFDDGYFNFVHALPVLREYQIPVTFFVCPGYMVNSQSFWWDVIYRKARSGGVAEGSVRREMWRLRTKPFDDIHSHITDRWGKHAMRSSNDLDRPLSLDEFKEVAREPLVHVGNHTFHHTTLPFQTEIGIHKELRLAEEFFERELGKKPNVVSYPNGDYGDSIIAICEQRGYELGMTIDARRNAYGKNAASSQRLSLGRYTLSGERDVKRQAKSIAQPYSVSGAIRRLRKHKHG